MSLTQRAWRRLQTSKFAVAFAALLLSFGFLYGEVIAKLVFDWAHDDNYSHGFLVVPLAAYLAWERRYRLAALSLAPSGWGLLLTLGSIAVLVAGTLGAELFLTRISILGTLSGAIVFLLGWRHLQTLAFPLAFLVLMIPLPAIIFNQIAFPLQLLASRFGETVLSALEVPVLREGNLMVLPNMTLEVAEACSGIRSLISLVTLSIIFGYFNDPRTGVRVAIAAATVPIAVLTNGLRVAGTGIAAYYYGPAAADGFFHEFSGWLVFVFAFLLLFLLQQLIRRVVPQANADVAISQTQIA